MRKRVRTGVHAERELGKEAGREGAAAGGAGRLGADLGSAPGWAGLDPVAVPHGALCGL